MSILQIEAIVGQHGLVVITRENSNPNAFIYNSDVLTKYTVNIDIKIVSCVVRNLNFPAEHHNSHRMVQKRRKFHENTTSPPKIRIRKVLNL